jgi:hypothetical protein
VKLVRFRKPKAVYFFLYVKYRFNTNTRNIMYTYKYIQSMYPKVKQLEETKGEGKEGKKDSE